MIAGVSATTATSADPISEATAVGGYNEAPSRSSWSPPAQLFMKLGQLSSNDSQKLGAVFDEVGRKLKDAAKSANDPGEKQALRRLSERFGQTLDDGEVIDVTPAPVVVAEPDAQTSSLGHVSAAPQGRIACRAYQSTMDSAAEQKTSVLFSQLCDVVDSVALH